MMCRRFVGSALVLATAAGTAFGIDVTRPLDAIVGSSTNFPAGEPPSAAIDNSAATKYLNFDRVNTGFTVTPSGFGVVRYLTIVTANDSPARDPMSYTLEGSDDGVNFTFIGQGAIASPTARFSITTSEVTGNTSTFAQYRVLFPTIRDAVSANSMQVAEVHLATSIDITSPADLVTVQLPKGAFTNANEGVANLFDNRLNTKFNVQDATAGQTTVIVTPALGPTILNGLAFFGGNDDVAFPGRTPQGVHISGSDDGVNFTEIFSTALQQASANYQDQEFEFDNSTAYFQYRVVFDVPSFDTDMQIGEIQLFGQTPTEPPANDNCDGARVIGAGTVSGANLRSTDSGTLGCGSNDSLDVWYSYTATADGLVEANTCGSTSDTTLAVFAACGGASIGCDDNGCGLQSVVRWEAEAGATYLVRVALNAGETGTFRVTIDDAPVVHADVALPLARNWNGMVHPTESGQPDNPDGYRAIADRGLFLDGAAGAFDAGSVVNAERMTYTIERNAGALDLVMLGNRNTVGGGQRAFDLKADGDANGIQPNWLPVADLTGPQRSDLSSLGAVMGADTSLGILYQVTNGGGTANVTLEFADSSTLVVAISGPDWFQDQNPPAAGPGVLIQRKFGVFRGAGQTDIGLLDNNLNVAEAIISVQDLIADGFGDVTGRELAAITFSDRSNTNAAYGFIAATLRDPGAGEPECRADFNNDDLVNSQDFFDFLTAFFATAPNADFNEDGLINSQDFFDFLTAFFAGC